MLKTIHTILLFVLFFAYCSKPSKTANNNSMQPKATGKIKEIILIDTNSQLPTFHDLFAIFFVVETQNLHFDTLKFSQPEINEYGEDTFLYQGFYSRYNKGAFTPLYLDFYRKAVIIPPFSKQIDTIPIIKAKKVYSYEEQIEWANEYKSGANHLVYLPRRAPFYQDTIFYTFGDDVKYSSRLH